MFCFKMSTEDSGNFIRFPKVYTEILKSLRNSPQTVKATELVVGWLLSDTSGVPFDYFYIHFYK